MASKQALVKSENTASSVKPLVTREGLTKHAGDVVGFHDLEEQGHIFGIPRGAKASDSQLDETKPSVFVIFELLEACECTEGSGDDSATVQAKPGDMVGVWIKGGMRNLRNMGGMKVLMQYTGEKKLRGKPAAYSAMKTYQCDTAGKGTVIPIIEDNRKTSRDVVNYWLPAASGKPVSNVPQRQPGDDAEDDYDFPS